VKQPGNRPPNRRRGANHTGALVGAGCGPAPVMGAAHRVKLGDLQVEQRGAPLALAVLLPDEVLLRVAGHLRGRPRGHVVPRDLAPLALRAGARRVRRAPALSARPPTRGKPGPSCTDPAPDAAQTRGFVRPAPRGPCAPQGARARGSGAAPVEGSKTRKQGLSSEQRHWPTGSAPNSLPSSVGGLGLQARHPTACRALWVARAHPQARLQRQQEAAVLRLRPGRALLALAARLRLLGAVLLGRLGAADAWGVGPAGRRDGSRHFRAGCGLVRLAAGAGGKDGELRCGSNICVRRLETGWWITEAGSED